MNKPPPPEDAADQAEETLSPVEIALAAMQGLLASGQFSDHPQSAGVLAWQFVVYADVPLPRRRRPGA